MTQPSSAPPLPKLGPYDVRGKIADGGMAAVYVAKRDDRLVAIKVIRDEFARTKEFRTMFLDEAAIAARLEHPNVVRYFELGGDAAGPAYIVMELLQGQSLWAVWEAAHARGVRLRYDVLAWIGARVAEGLHYAHELHGEDGTPLDIVHRDVNATNIFVTYDGAIKIIDFGLAKAANRASKTAAGIIKGKVAYMSPEQAVGAPVDRRTDIFALGTTLWEIACDRRLFKRSDEVETLRRVHAAEVPDPRLLVAGFPDRLWSILQHALERETEKRYATAAQMARDLDAFADGTVNQQVVAEVMNELFAQEKAHATAWMTDASAPGSRPSKEPLKRRSTFLEDEGDVRPSAPAAIPPAPVAAAPADSLARRLAPALLAIAIVIAVVVIAALALR
ncbi:MAG TPA: serine/threonine-protein kinase [Polyangiaceae bacterium]|nr:serine/threonine-protein kinase [Polyangiaceae bacterium]